MKGGVGSRVGAGTMPKEPRAVGWRGRGVPDCGGGAACAEERECEGAGDGGLCGGEGEAAGESGDALRGVGVAVGNVGLALI